MNENDGLDNFYTSYARHKKYAMPTLSKKDAGRFDDEIWEPATFAPEHRCLEIGCGTGLFLAYLSSKGVSNFIGVDQDPALAEVIPDGLINRFLCVDAWVYLEDSPPAHYDRVVLLDVLEHFTAKDGFQLMSLIARVLTPDGKVVIKVPNAASPWGLSYQVGDLTHCTGYSENSLHQLATASGFVVDVVYDQRRGSPRRKMTDAIVNHFLSWTLLTPPKFWGANLYAVLSRP